MLHHVPKHLSIYSRRAAITAGLLFAGLSFGSVQEETVASGINPLQQQAAEIAIQRGLDWLVGIQQESGAWSNTNFPALTAMPLWAMARSGRDDLLPNMHKAIQYILTCVKEQGPEKGAIYQPVAGRRGGGLSNYNTALSLVALHAMHNSPLRAKLADAETWPDLVPVMLNARAFLANSQHLGESLHFGGMGYDPPTERVYADLSNSYIGYEAMRLTQDMEELRPGPTRVNLNWQAAITFVQRIHNHPEFNDLPWVSDSPEEKGGFAYRTDTFREDFGAYTDENGVQKYRSAQTMTYAGLLSYLYAGLDRNDPRVTTTVAWIRNNWNPKKPNRNPELAGTAEEMGGLFYYYTVMTRALQIHGEDLHTLADGTVINWRNDVISAIVALQREDGSWLNEYGRYWEADPVLVTAYSLLALQNALAQ